MIVDDEVADRLFFSNAVKKIDPSWKCVQASCPEEALTMLQAAEKLPDYIFVDINMPGMDGIEFLAAIKTDEKWVQIPVIICTASINQEDLRLTTALGASYYMVKQQDTRKLPDEIKLAIEKTDDETAFAKIVSENKKLKDS